MWSSWSRKIQGAPERSQEYQQAFRKRFSGPIRALFLDRAGADAWQITTYGHGVLQTNPHGSALDQESPGSIPGGATRSARRDYCVSRFLRFWGLQALYKRFSREGPAPHHLLPTFLSRSLTGVLITASMPSVVANW